MCCRIVAGVAGALGLVSQVLGAQSRLDDLAAFYALSFSPAGALPPIVHIRAAGDSLKRGVAEVRYGRYRYRDDPQAFDNYGVGGRFRVIRRVEVGGSIGYRTCGRCEGLTMLSLDVASPLLHRNALEPGAGDSEVGLLASVGRGKPSKASFRTMSAAVSLPITVTVPQEARGLLALSAIPGIGYGRLTDDSTVVLGSAGTFASWRFVFAASVGYLFPFGLGAHVSVHRIAIEEATTQWGVAFSWRY